MKAAGSMGPRMARASTHTDPSRSTVSSAIGTIDLYESSTIPPTHVGPEPPPRSLPFTQGLMEIARAYPKAVAAVMIAGILPLGAAVPLSSSFTAPSAPVQTSVQSPSSELPRFLRMLRGEERRGVAGRVWRLVNQTSEAEQRVRFEHAGIPQSYLCEHLDLVDRNFSPPIASAPAPLRKAAQFMVALRLMKLPSEVLESLLGPDATAVHLSAVDHFYFNAAFSSVVGVLPAAAAGLAYDGLLQGLAQPVIDGIGGRPANEAWRDLGYNWRQVVDEDLQGAVAGPIARAELGARARFSRSD